MKFLLVAINAKYIHANPAVYSLLAYAKKKNEELAASVEIAEYTINQSVESILADLYQRKPTMIGFSCYIWNIEYVYRLIPELKKILPKVQIWLGGPEVSYDARDVLADHRELAGVMTGEGEAAFFELLHYYAKGKAQPPVISGVVWQGHESGEDRENMEDRNLPKLSELPFLYGETEKFAHKILYYESSRGCPFRCSYCLSSIDKTVRFRDLDLVREELQFFLDKRVAQVKFVDRTFNCSHSHAMEIWRYIRDHDNGVTNFHFEIAADLLNEEELALIRTFRTGAVQMEIGVQSTNAAVIAEIDRTMDLAALTRNVEKLREGGNVHIHLDLIAGLPEEDYASFQRSFNEVFAMRPQQLQLGFLKVLKGSKMYRKAAEYGMVYTEYPPYEVLYTKWLSYGELLSLKRVERMVELFYNSSQFRHTVSALLQGFASPFALFEALADFYEAHHYFVRTPSRAEHYQILLRFAEEHFSENAGWLRETLTVDYYLREKAKARPLFAGEIDSERLHMRQFFHQESVRHRYLTAEAYMQADAKSLSRMAHLEPLHYDLITGEALLKTAYLLFDYENRNPLTHDARTHFVEWRDMDS